MITKEEFIGNFLDRARRLRNHNLPYGFEYFSLLEKVELDAERAWKKYNRLK
jgi:hypothetical protein